MGRSSQQITQAPVVVAGTERIELDSDKGRELVEDLARWSEGVLTTEEARDRWGIDDDQEWSLLKADVELVRAVRLRRVERETSGLSAREKARRFFNEAPEVLRDILSDIAAPARSRIDAARELRAEAGFGDESADTGGPRFHLEIHIGDGRPPITIDAPRREPDFTPGVKSIEDLDLDAVLGPATQDGVPDDEAFEFPEDGE